MISLPSNPSPQVLHESFGIVLISESPKIYYFSILGEHMYHRGVKWKLMGFFLEIQLYQFDVLQADTWEDVGYLERV